MAKSSGSIRSASAAPGRNAGNNATQSAAVKLTPSQQKEHINQVKRALERHTGCELLSD